MKKNIIEAKKKVTKNPTQNKKLKTNVKENSKNNNLEKTIVSKEKISKKSSKKIISKVSRSNKKYSLASEEQVINPIPSKEALVKLRNVDVQFGKTKFATKAMKNISFNIYHGEVLGLVGESGSGKSTTGNAIIGLVDRKSGDITIDDVYIKHRTKNIGLNFRKKIAGITQMIFQDPTNSLNPQKTVRKVISEGLDNQNPRSVFAREFDITTINRLSDILHNKKQPSFLEKITVKSLLKLIEQNKLNVVYEKVYVKSIISLKKMKTKHCELACSFLELRKAEREYFLGVSKRLSNKRIKDHMINDMIKSVGLTKQILNRYPLEFSGGQQQRISISRSVIVKPKLLIADEPISALDVSIQAQVVNIFNDLKEKFNLTILFIAHDLRMVEYISDRIAIMYKGNLLEIGDANIISKNPVHPYSKSLLASVPSIDKIKTKLSKEKYNDRVHKYNSKNKPSWFKITNENHFVFATEEEIKKWI